MGVAFLGSQHCHSHLHKSPRSQNMSSTAPTLAYPPHFSKNGPNIHPLDKWVIGNPSHTFLSLNSYIHFLTKFFHLYCLSPSSNASAPTSLIRDRSKKLLKRDFSQDKQSQATLPWLCPRRSLQPPAKLAQHSRSQAFAPT